VKTEQDWPADVQAREQHNDEDKDLDSGESQLEDEEDEWRQTRGEGSTKHHGVLVRVTETIN